MLRLLASEATRNWLPSERTSASRCGHPLARLGQVACDLGADPEQMKRVRAAGHVAGRVAHLERLAREPPSFGYVRSQCHSRQSA